MTKIKTYEYKGREYEIREILEDGKYTYRVYLDDNLFSPYTYSMSEEMKALIEQKIPDIRLYEELIKTVEEGIKIWADNGNN